MDKKTLNTMEDEKLEKKITKSPLPDDSALYQKEKKRSEKEKWKSFNSKQKFNYFCDYYLFRFIGIAVGVFIGLFLIIHFATKKDMIMGILAVNADGENVVASGPEYFNDFLTQNGVDTGKNAINLNITMYIQAGSDEAIDQTNLQTINTLFYSRSVDVFMSDEAFFDVMAKGDYLVDLNDYLPQDLLKAQENNIVYVYDSELSKEIAAGVRIDTTSNKWITDTGWYEMPEIIVGLADGMKSPDLSIKMLEDILSE